MTTFVLVHGSWHGGWCWDRLVPLLVTKGHKVLAPDLPGMGADKTPLQDVTLAKWAEFIADLARSAGEPVVLVGHSRGGVVISQAAEYAPGAVRALVYLTAILLPNGGHVMQLADQMSGAGVAAMQLSDDGLSTTLSLEAAPGLLYNSTDAEGVAFALPRLGLDPNAPNMEPLNLTPERYGSVPRFYIECLRDNTLSIALQRRLQAGQPCRRVVTMDTDHSPFLSAPQALTDILCEIDGSLGVKARPAPARFPRNLLNALFRR